jgi:hypothetical protein
LKKAILYFVIAIPAMLFGQKKVDLDKFRFSVQYRALPQMKVDSSYRTYNVIIEGSKLMQPFLKDIDPEKTVVLKSWKKLPHDGHLAIKVKLDDLLPESAGVKERIETTKDRNGVISTKTYYHEEVVYSFAANASISNYKGEHIMDEELVTRNYKRTYSSPEFTIKKLAEGYFLFNAASVCRELYRNAINSAMHDLSNRITDNFGFNEVASNDYMWIIDSKKHPEYEESRRMMQQLQNVLVNMNASTPIDGLKEKLQPAIKYFEEIKNTYSSTSKHDRKMRYASYFNLAVLYYYLDDPQSMIKEANGLALNDYDSKDARGFIQTATWLKKLFEQNNIYTRHFSMDPATFKGPYESENTAAINK